MEHKYSKLGKKMRALRTLMDITQETAAADSGMSVATVRRIDRGQGAEKKSVERYLAVLSEYARIPVLVAEVTRLQNRLESLRISEGRRVLLAEDDPTQLQALSKLLRMHSFDVAAYSTGVEALTCLTDYAPDVFVLDIVMPGLDGIEVCRQLQALPAAADVQVVIVSGALSPAKEKAAREAGALVCFEKPLSTSDFLQFLNSITAPEAE